MYEIKMAAFLFVRALHKTAEFRLASNVDGLGAFDDLVFRYRLKEQNVWKTCFIQLKHKEKGGTFPQSSLINMSGEFSLFKYFESYCQIKSKLSTEQSLKHYGKFDDFEFVIYTNARIKTNSSLERANSEHLSILSSGTNGGKYITFDEAVDTEVFKFFEDLSKYQDLLVELDELLARGTDVGTEIDHKIESFEDAVTNTMIVGKLQSLKPNLNKGGVNRLRGELGKCDFTLYKEFLSKVKIFPSQSKESSLEGLIEKELNVTCKASPSVAKSIYTKFEEGFSKWWKLDGNVVWLSNNARLWQDVVTHIITEISEISEPKPQKFDECGVCFIQPHIQRLVNAIKDNTFLNIVTKSEIRYLQQLKSYQALNNLGYTNSLFIGLKSLKGRHKEVRKLWPSKWSAAIVIDCDCGGKVADILLDILQESVGCEKGLEISDGNMLETLVAVLQKYEQKVILISTRQHMNLTSHVQEELGNINGVYEDNCILSDLDAKSQRQILERTLNLQGIDVTLSTLAGTHLPECMKSLVDSDVISILLSNEHKLCVGRQLSDLPKYCVPQVLQHRIYLKQNILKQTHKSITYAVSGLQADELKKYLPVGEKICEFVYDEREGSHFFKIVPDLFTIGLSTELDNMQANNNILCEKTTECDFSESRKNIASMIADNFSKPGLSAELENKKAYNKLGQKIKPEEVRYVILGNKNPESKFWELKAQLANAHWIHVEEGSFLWRDSNCNIDIIRGYIDKTKCRKYDIESATKQSDRTMLLVAGAGMGKSTFLSHMEHEIKKRNKAVWVLRINLNEHTQLLAHTKFEEECIDKCKMFLWKVACSPEQCTAKLVEKIFLQALEQTGKMVIILDGFDEISPLYTPKVNILIRAIRDGTASQIFISSRFSCRQNLEDILIKLAFTLQPFSRENQIEFLEQYWNKGNEISKQENLRKFAKKLVNSCSQNFSDKDGEFTCIPLQTMMLGEAFVKEAEEYCLKGDLNLPEKFDLLDLFNKFWEKKCDIYFSEKNAMDTSKPKVIKEKELYFGYHMIAALMSFPLSEKHGLLGAINARDLEQANMFLESDMVEKFGTIREMTDGKPHFIHRCFAEYFAAKWFTDNFTKCKDFISDTLFDSTYEVTRNIFDRMLAKGYKIHGTILNNDISAVEELLKSGTDINKTDKGGRTALHLAASYNSPVTQKLLSCPVVDTKIPDKILKWTSLRYADRMKWWLAMDILLENCANPKDIVLTRPNREAQECEKEAL
jgi:hypothetical protein